jgi:hypothetical protein
LDAQQQVDFVAPSDVGIGPIQLGGPPTGAGAPSVSTLAQPSYSTLLSEVTAAYGSTAPVDDFQRGVVAAVNGGTEVDGSTPGSDAAARIIEAEEGTPSGVAEACLNATADGCVATLDAAGYAATNEGPEAVGRYQLPYPNGFDPVGTAEMLNPLSVMNDVNGSEVFGEQWAVHMNLDTTTGNDHVLPGSAVGVYSEPADVVPRCDGSGRSTASWGTYGPMYYPMQFSDCLTALGGGGFSNVVEEPLSGAMWGDFWGCGGDPCDAGDPSGTVEWMTTTDPTTYSSGSYSWNYAGGAQVTPLTQPIFVYVEGWDGAVVGAPPVTTTTGTTTTGSTSTGTTTTGSTDTSTTGSTSTATTQSTDTSTTGSTSTSTTQSTDTSTTGSTSTSTTQSTDTSTTGSTSTSTTQSTDTGTDTTTTTTPSDNCVVSDTCDPPNPFNGPTTDPSGIHFPVVHTPCTVFPFGVPCYVASQVEALNQTPVPPGMTVAIPIPGSGGHKASASFNLGQLPFDINSYMWAVRDFFLILTGVGIVLWLTRRGSQGGDSGDGGAGGSSDQESGYINWEDV